MYFSSSVLSLSLLALVATSPITKIVEKSSTLAARAAATAGETYNQISISGGTAGNAQAEANALFTNIDMNDLAGVSAADLAVVKNIHDVAEDAETEAFNPAISAASGSAATALQNGKIKNKVLKLTAEVLGIQIEAAQGGSSSDLAAEQKKLANNIKLDTAAAGQASTAVSFTGTI